MADILKDLGSALNSIYYSLPPLLPHTKEVEKVIIKEISMFGIPQGSRTFIRIAGLSGAIAVALGAYGSHDVRKKRLWAAWIENLLEIDEAAWDPTEDHYLYKEMKYRVLHGGKLTDMFKITTGVQQGCLFFVTFIILTNYRLDHETKVATTINGIQRKESVSVLDDLDFIDDNVLMSCI